MNKVDYSLILKENFPIIKDIILLIFGGIASYVTLQGLNTWKRQLKGKDEYELCKRILIELYKYKNGIIIVRNPAMFLYEFEEKDEISIPDKKEKHFKNLKYAYEERWKNVQENRIKLNLSILESRVYWDEELEKLFMPIFEFENKLFNSLQEHLLISNPNIDDDYKKYVGKVFHEEDKRKILYFFGNKDVYYLELENNIKDIEDFIKIKLKK